MILVSITFSLGPDKTMLDLAWRKCVYAAKIDTLSAIQRFIYLQDIKQNEESTSVYTDTSMGR